MHRAHKKPISHKPIHPIPTKISKYTHTIQTNKIMKKSESKTNPVGRSKENASRISRTRYWIGLCYNRRFLAVHTFGIFLQFQFCDAHRPYQSYTRYCQGWVVCNRADVGNVRGPIITCCLVVLFSLKCSLMLLIYVKCFDTCLIEVGGMCQGVLNS